MYHSALWTETNNNRLAYRNWEREREEEGGGKRTDRQKKTNN